MNSTEKRTNKALAARINRRMSEGWSLEKIGQRTVWTMYGHLYSIRDGALVVSMAGGKQTFRPDSACKACGVVNGPHATGCASAYPKAVQHA